MEDKTYADLDDGQNSDSDSSSTDSGNHTITPSSESYDNTPPSTEDKVAQDITHGEKVAERDDDDTSSSDSSVEDGDVITNNTKANIQTDRSVNETSYNISTTEEVGLHQSPETNDRTQVVKKEAARLSARLGHMSIVDSVVVRKKGRGRISESELYNEIGKLVTDNTNEVGAEQEDKAQDQTDKEEIKTSTHHPDKDNDKSSETDDSKENTHKNISDDESDQEDVGESGISTKVKVSRGVDWKVTTSDMVEVELDNVVDSMDDTCNDDSKHGVFSTCCCFRGARTS